MTKRVMFINEFGSGLTHFNALLGAYHRIKAETEIDAQFYVPKPQAVFGSGFAEAPVLACPAQEFSRTSHKKLKNRTFGEIVFNALFEKHADPLEWCKAWDRAFCDFNPHLVVTDYAPVAQMVAYGRWPTISIGYGYTMPPSGLERFVTFGQETPKPKEELAMAEQFNGLLKAVGARQLEKFPDFCAADAQVNATVPPFDPYIDHRPGGHYAGIHHPNGSPWPANGAEGGVAYFHGFSQDDEGLLQGLVDSRLDFDFYAGAPLPAAQAMLAGTKVRQHDKPLNLKALLPGKAVCVHMGGQGVALAALFAGVPQVMLCTHMENSFNARMVATQGAGIRMALTEVTRKSLMSLIIEAANDGGMRRKAFEMGRALAQYRDADPVAVLAGRALAMLKSG